MKNEKNYTIISSRYPLKWFWFCVYFRFPWLGLTFLSSMGNLLNKGLSDMVEIILCLIGIVVLYISIMASIKAWHFKKVALKYIYILLVVVIALNAYVVLTLFLNAMSGYTLGNVINIVICVLEYLYFYKRRELFVDIIDNSYVRYKYTKENSVSSEENLEFIQSMKKHNEISEQEAIDTVVKTLSEQTVKNYAENSKNQPNYEDDVDFGLVQHKPIYTSALMLIDGEIEYLNRLYTEAGDKITWNRQGSVVVDDINGIIDVYDTFLPSGELYETIYINMYGAEESRKAPKGFILYDRELKQEKSNKEDKTTKPLKKIIWNDKEQGYFESKAKSEDVLKETIKKNYRTSQKILSNKKDKGKILSIAKNVLIIAYVLYLTIQCLFCVPHDIYTVTYSSQNVPHFIKSGRHVGNLWYDGLKYKIERLDETRGWADKNTIRRPSQISKIAYPRLIIPLSVASIVYIALYFFITKRITQIVQGTPPEKITKENLDINKG